MPFSHDDNRTEIRPSTSPGATACPQPSATVAVEASGWFASLYSERRLRVYNVAARILCNTDDAADVTQDVFLRVLAHPPDAQTLENPEPWLYRITVNACFDHLRRRKSRPCVELDDAGELLAPHDGFEAAALTHAVEEALGALTPRYRAALVLRDLRGLETDEVAMALGTSATTARVLVHRARGAFRKAFRGVAPAGPSALPGLALVALLPELPLPASLQAIPAVGATVVTVVAAGTTAVTATAGTAAGAAGAAAVAAPAAIAPLPAVGVLAKLAATGVGLKGVAVAAAAVTVVAGGGLAAGHIAARDDGARGGAQHGAAAAPANPIGQMKGSAGHGDAPAGPGLGTKGGLLEARGAGSGSGGGTPGSLKPADRGAGDQPGGGTGDQPGGGGAGDGSGSGSGSGPGGATDGSGTTGGAGGGSGSGGR